MYYLRLALFILLKLYDSTLKFYEIRGLKNNLNSSFTLCHTNCVPLNLGPFAIILILGLSPQFPVGHYKFLLHKFCENRALKLGGPRYN